MKNVLLSVVVTIYNMENSIEKCIKSIVSQKYENLEIIIVDDGSTDNSYKICSDLFTEDDRIKLYRIRNSGPIEARKFGVNKATASLITFVDADDWIEADMYFSMMKMYSKYGVDIIISGLTYDGLNFSNKEIDNVKIGVYNKYEIINYILPFMMYDEMTGKRRITPSLVNKIFKKDLLLQYYENKNKSISYGEDALVTYYCIAKSNSIYFTGQSWYHYMVNENSMSHEYNYDSFKKIREFQCCMEENFKKIGMWERIENQVPRYVRLLLTLATNKIFSIELDDSKYLFPYSIVEKNSKVIIYGAGNVGCSYIKCLLKDTYAEIVGWADRNADNLSYTFFEVEHIGKLLDKEFDYIIIAILDSDEADKIINDLCRLGVEKEKIIWKKPIIL